MSNLEKHLISAQDCEVYSEEYINTNYVEINKNRPTEKPDSSYYFIELDVLQEYLKMIDAEMGEKGVKRKGVKVCLAKYPEKSSDSKLNQDYLGYQTIYFAPIDLTDKISADMNKFVETETAKDMDDTPNLNYMGISPPH